LSTPVLPWDVSADYLERRTHADCHGVAGEVVWRIEAILAVAEAMIDAPGSQCLALSMTAKSLMGCLEAEVTGDDSVMVQREMEISVCGVS
jgi:hypothetical protein